MNSGFFFLLFLLKDEFVLMFKTLKNSKVLYLAGQELCLIYAPYHCL